ncbi:MAG: NADPH-dependent 7-cyano-7-deazaguanine reductase QueF [Pseudomonadales bacterium]|nr:NADPH-dependent 7-cyano-7-deazaguanine reductase QueF [Pseudomonadales bacterium]
MDARFYAKTPLGQVSAYPSTYDPSLLVALPREEGRVSLGLSHELSFQGVDIWNAYEVSWLDATGKPVVAMVEIRIPADSPCMVESKSLKLYLCSMHQQSWANPEDWVKTVTDDLQHVVASPVEVRVMAQDSVIGQIGKLQGDSLDHLPVRHVATTPEPSLLTCQAGTWVEASWYSHLFKSNCPVTGQPDWASVLVHYRGACIDAEGLLAYLLSFRQHADFHEHCVESIYMDIWRQCQPEALSVYARYTRRGGIDINPFRSNFETAPANIRLFRQ